MSNIGAWAAETERADAEEREAAAAAAAAGRPTTAESQSFPSLKEVVSTKPKKKKMTLSEFTMGAYSSSVAIDSYNRLTPDEMLRLPTAPRERSVEEMQQSRLGGGFSSYERPARTLRDRNDSWGSANRRSHGGFDDEQPQRRGPPPRASEFDQPSRADEVNNWAMAKKSIQTVQSHDSSRQNRYDGLGSGGGFSRADEVDNWTSGKKPIPTRSSTFDFGFRSSGPEPDRWTRGAGGFREERSRLNLDPTKPVWGGNDTAVVKTSKPNPFGAARPREEVLAEKGLDWKKLEMEMETKKLITSRPTSSNSSRPSSEQSSRSESQGLQGLENLVKPGRPKVNPFGDAKPREVLLEERRHDWRKIDLELERRQLERPETEEEKILKEEIYQLKKEHEKDSRAEANQESLQGSGGDQSSLLDIMHNKEHKLEMLIGDLDDKVRFGQKAVERPYGLDRAAGFSERVLSQSGSFDESRSMESIDRPRSQGVTDAWARPGDDRRSYQGGRERGLLGSRDLDRQSFRERW